MSARAVKPLLLRGARVVTMDPRRRIVDLWRGAEPDAPLDLPALRAFHAAFRAENHVVVHVNAVE